MRSLPLRVPVLVLAGIAAWTSSLARVDATDATAAPNPSPVRIERCSVAGQSALENPKLGLRLAQVSGVTIVYTNERDSVATEVRFRVRYQGVTGVLVDRGSLAPGRQINREFTNFNAIFAGSDSADCSVSSVVFADGTRWDAAPEPQRTGARH